MNIDWGSGGMEMESETHQDAYPRRLEWIAVVLLIIDLIMLMYATSLYYDEQTWAQTMIALHTATAVILLASVIFSIFGLTPLSRIAISIGILVFMIAVVSLGIRLADVVSSRGYL
jgi:hypothetical protein